MSLFYFDASIQGFENRRDCVNETNRKEIEVSRVFLGLLA